MNTPLNAVAALALALSSPAGAVPPVPAGDAAPKTVVSAGDSASQTSNNYNQGTTADGKTIVAPGTYGPFQGPTCEAGPGCSAASAPTQLSTLPPGSMSGMSNVEGPLLDIGRAQQADAGAKGTISPEQQKMLDDHTFKSVVPLPGGETMITLSNGDVTFENRDHTADTMPVKLEDILKDPKSTPAMIAAAQKALTDKANSAMFSGTSGGGGMSALSVKPKCGGVTEAGSEDPTPTTGPTGGAPGGDASSGPGGFPTGQDLGRAMVDIGGGSPNSSGSVGGAPAPGGASSDQAREENRRTMEALAATTVLHAGAEDADQYYEYEHNKTVARRIHGYKTDVESQFTVGSGDTGGQGEAPAGSKFFTSPARR
jgi:hypothetical protein